MTTKSLAFVNEPQIILVLGKSRIPGARFSKVPRTFRARKAIRKITTCLFCKAGLFISYVVKGMKLKITAKFRASRRLRFEDTKRITSPEIRPKSFGTFEKRASGVSVFYIIM